MTPTFRVELIDLSKDDDDVPTNNTGHAQPSQSQRRAASRKSTTSQRLDAKSSIIDLTEDDIQSLTSQLSPQQTRAKSPPGRRDGTALPPNMRSRLGSQASHTRSSPTGNKVTSPVIPSSDSDELPFDPLPPSSSSRRVSKPSAKARESFHSDFKDPTRPASSPKKRTREEAEDTQSSRPAKKRRPFGESTSLRSVEAATPRAAVSLSRQALEGVTSSSSSKKRREQVTTLRSELSPTLRKEDSPTTSSRPSRTNSIVVPELTDGNPTEATPRANSSNESSPTKRRSDLVTSRSSSKSREESSMPGSIAREHDRYAVFEQTANDSPQNEPMVPARQTSNRENTRASEPVRQPKNRPNGLKATKSATPLRKVSNAGSASAGASPSSQLQREIEENPAPPTHGSLEPEDQILGDGRPIEKHGGEVGDHSAQDSSGIVENQALAGGSAPTHSGETGNAAPPDWSMFSVELQVERILGKYYQEMREDTDYFTKASLKRARRSIELHRPKQVPDPARDVGSKQPSVASSVFARLRRAAITQPTMATAKIGDGNTKLNVDVYNGASKPIRSHFNIKTTACNTSALGNEVPEYAHYVSLKSSILAPNATTMTVWPYFGDGEPDSEEFEHVYDMDTDERHRKIRRLLEAQKVEEYLDSVLHDLKISWDDVLRFLLEPAPEVGANKVAQAATKSKHLFLEDFPQIDGSRKWQKVLAALSSSSPDILVKAAILCDNFQRMAKFPLWHVARRSATVRRVFIADEKPPSAVASRMCRLCFQFNCHTHGELREHDSDNESGVETDDAVAKDILYPPRVNYRKRLSLPQSRIVTESGNHAGVTSSLKIKKRNPKYWETADYLRPGELPPFYPCWHPDESCEEAKCSCVRQKRPCGKSCGCALDCPRRFEGCACSSKKLRRPGDFTCYRDDRCACYKIGAECDPDLCGACGVCEVLDPVHRHDPPLPGPKKLCHNAGIQKGIPKHTLLGDSGVHGMGLYAGERIEEHDFVGEYKGEIITKHEADRRGAVYEKQNSTYLFYLNPEQEVDSNFYGNKIRFINHRSEAAANIYPLIRQVNTVDRIGLFARTTIKPGEELFFDYGPKFPDHKLGGKQPVPSKTAPHVRNADALNDFYEVEEVEDEVGNRRAKKAANGKYRGRPRKAEPTAKSLKPKKPMGGARPGAGRKPGKKKAVTEKAAETTAGRSKVNDDEEADEDPRIIAQDRFEAYYVSQELNADQEDFDDEEFVGDVEASVEESEDESEDDAYESRRRTRGRPRKVEL